MWIATRKRSSDAWKSCTPRSRTPRAISSRELPLLILARDANGWTLRYTDEFNAQDRVSPLVPFPDVEKAYRSKETWPFFAVHIPSIARPEIERTVRCEQLDYSDVAAMLSRFGKRSITDPFELRPLVTSAAWR